MLRAIALKNFKAYEELKDLELRPLTVFCGANAVGKSSVIQALLMIQQTLGGQPDGQPVPLVTDGEDVSLGNYVDVVFGHDLGRELSAELTVALEGGEGEFWETPVTLTLLLEYYVTFGYNPGQYRSRIATPEIRHMRLAAATEVGQELASVDIRTDAHLGPPSDERGIEVDLRFGEQTQHSDRHFEESELRVRRIEDWFREPAPDGVTLAQWNDAFGPEELTGLVSRMLHEVSSRLTVAYISPDRQAPRRYYDANERSEKAGAWLRVEPPRSSGSPVVFHSDPESQVNAWLEWMDLPQVRRVLEGRDYRDVASSPYVRDCAVSVTDTGYGVSQVLQVLRAGIQGEEAILVLDQPELHLHPKPQAQIADFAIAVSAERQVLVETHSDHFVNRVVRRVVEGEIESDDVAVYFFTPTSDEGPKVEMVEVDPSYGIKNWPLGFFDDYANEQEAIVRAALSRRRRDRETRPSDG